MNKNETKTILITGSSSGIGKSLVIEFAKLGYNIVVNFRRSAEDAKRVKKEIESIAGNCRIIQADVTKPGDVKRLIEETVNYYNGIDILINGVGDYLKKPVNKLEFDEWQYILDSNLNSVFYMTRYVLPLMRKKKWGRIINFGIAGVEMLNKNPETAVYNIAKTGVLMLTESFAQTEAKYGITVNMISPGIIDNQKYSENYKKKIIKKIPAGKVGQPDDIFQILKFLVLDEANYINGANINVSGGYFII